MKHVFVAGKGCSCHVVQVCCHAVTLTGCKQEQEGVIASQSVEDVMLESCNARAVCFNCPSMTQLSLKLSNVVSFTLQDTSNLRCLDLQGQSTHLGLHLRKGTGEGLLDGLFNYVYCMTSALQVWRKLVLGVIIESAQKQATFLTCINK